MFLPKPPASHNGDPAARLKLTQKLPHRNSPHEARVPGSLAARFGLPTFDGVRVGVVGASVKAASYSP
jgi:hypothetical protein